MADIRPFNRYSQPYIPLRRAATRSLSLSPLAALDRRMTLRYIQLNISKLHR
jgi:hypothetical protein